MKKGKKNGLYQREQYKFGILQLPVYLPLCLSASLGLSFCLCLCVSLTISVEASQKAINRPTV